MVMEMEMVMEMKMVMEMEMNMSFAATKKADACGIVKSKIHKVI